MKKTNEETLAKSDTKTTAVSGCLIWFLLISFIGSCVMPVAMMAGGFTSASDLAIRTTGGWLCPEGTTPASFSYSTTSRDSSGFEHPATAYELTCLDANGEVVKSDPIVFAFLWIGTASLLGAVLTGILSFVFAVPGGMLVTRVVNSLRGKKAGV